MRELLRAEHIHVAERIHAASGEREEARECIPEETSYLDIRPQCPRCRANLDGLECPFCRFRMRVNHGIVHALPSDQAAHYARFMEDYKRIRESEGRGS